MKISGVSYLAGINPLITTKKQLNTNPITFGQKATVQAAPAVYYGRDLVHTEQSDFTQTLKENYFKLPEGCYPDRFQTDAGKAILTGKNVLVEAPTGTGKTAIAHYAVSKNMAEGKKTFYTTPLKALSNQKLNEFREVYGDENVGILTGDRRENADAPVVIMTTEVYRNMALSNMYGEDTLIDNKLGTVIFDEFHYLGDATRGPVWEESVMFTPKNVQTLALSATIGNPKQLNGWINKLSGGESELISVPSEARHVPLEYGSIKTSSYEAAVKRAQREGKKTLKQQDGFVKLSRPSMYDFKDAVKKLNKKDRLPAIFFVFSRRFSRELLDFMAQQGDDLTTKKEKEEIEQIVRKHKQAGYVGSDLDMFALKKGYAIHNAGIIPTQKALIEELFQKKLIKTVIATETLAAGINMPARTVVISSPYKPTDITESDNGVRALTANEFMQMSGRAGRRGIDKIGYVYTMPTDLMTEEEFKELQNSKSNPLYSNYSPDYAFLAGYFEHNDTPSRLKEVYGKSFYTNTGDAKLDKKNLEELTAASKAKTAVMKERGFISEADGKTVLNDTGYMASKIRGYNALALTETLASGAFKNMSPEALAMFAAEVANPVTRGDADTPVNNEINSSVKTIDEKIDAVYSRMYDSVKATLLNLGTTIDAFNDFEEIVAFASTIERPDASDDELRTKVSELSTLLNTRKQISSTREKYSSTELVNALKNEQKVPSQVLNESLVKVEEYKKRIPAKSISAQIEKMKAEYLNIPTGKGTKAKAHAEKRRQALSEDIEFAKRMDYLDKHLRDAISENYNFIKSHDFESIKREYKKCVSELSRLNARETLETQARGLQSIYEYRTSGDTSEINNKNAKSIRNALNIMQTKSSEVYLAEAKHKLNTTEPRYGSEAAANVFNWAALNKVNVNSKANWAQMIKSADMKYTDEGSIYRNIMQTADLLSQIGETARAGADVARNKAKQGNPEDFADEYTYYSNLAKTASEARKLLIQEPVRV